MFHFNISNSCRRESHNYIYRKSLLKHFLHLVILLLAIESLRVESIKVTTDRKINEICPCLPMHKCPRIYGQSAHDIRELGFLERCHQFGTVRCCGITIRVEHEKESSKQNWDDLIGAVKNREELDITFPHQRTKNIINIKRDLQGVNTLTNVTKTTVKENSAGVDESWLPTSGNSLMKFRRRKLFNVSKKGFTTSNGSTQEPKEMKTSASGDLSTGGGQTPGIFDSSSIKSNSSSTPSLFISTQNEGLGVSPRSHFQPSQRKLLGKITEIHGAEESITSGSKDSSVLMTSTTSSGSSKVTPVFSRMRKPILKFGIKVDSNLPTTVSVMRTKIFPDKKEKEPLTPASIEKSLTPALDLTINVEKEVLKGSSPPLLSSSSQGTPVNKKNSGIQTTKNFRTQINSIPRSSTFRNNSFLLTKKIRPISINNRLSSSNVNMTQGSFHSELGGTTPSPNIKSKTFRNPNSKFITNSDTNSKSEKIENSRSGAHATTMSSSNAAIKLRRPIRPVIHRQSIQQKLSFPSPPSQVEVSGFKLISSTTAAFKIEEEPPVTLPSVLPKQRNRIRIHRLPTTTSTTTPTPKKIKSRIYNVSTNQSPPPSRQSLSNKPLDEEDNERTFHSKSHQVDQEPGSYTSQRKDSIEDLYHHHSINTQETHLLNEASTTLESMQIKEPEFISSGKRMPWSEESRNSSPLPSIDIHDHSLDVPETRMSRVGGMDTSSYQRPSPHLYSHNQDQNEEIEETQSYTTSPPLRKRKKPPQLTSTSTYTRIRNGVNNPPALDSIGSLNPTSSQSSPSNHMSNTKPSRRFKVPTNFPRNGPMIEEVREEIQTTTKAYYEQENGDWTSTGENYDMTLDKEAREYLKSNPVPVTSSPESNSHINDFNPPLPERQSFGYHPEEMTSDALTESSYSTPIEDDEVEEETRVHMKFIEKTSPTPLPPLSVPFVQNVNKQDKEIKYRRIPAQKMGYDTLRTPESTSSSSSVNNERKMTIINSQRMEQSLPTYENVMRKLSKENQNIKSKRVKEIFSPLPTSSTPSLPPFDTTSEKPTSTFTFPPFNRQGISDIDTTIPPVTTIPTELQPNKLNSKKIGFELTRVSTSTSPSISSLSQTRVHEETPTVSFIPQQILPTETPTSIPSTTTPMPIPIQSISTFSNQQNTFSTFGQSSAPQNKVREYQSTFSDLRPIKPKSSRFTISQIFNSSRSSPRNENLGNTFKFPTESTPPPYTSFSTNEMRAPTNLNHNFHPLTFHHQGEPLQIMQYEKNEKAKTLLHQFPLHLAPKTESRNPLSPSNPFNLQSSLPTENPRALISSPQTQPGEEVTEKTSNQFQNLYSEPNHLNIEHRIPLPLPPNGSHNIRTLYTNSSNQEKLQTYINVNNKHLPLPSPSPSPSPQTTFMSTPSNLPTKQSSNETFISKSSSPFQHTKFTPSIRLNDDFNLPTLHSTSIPFNSVHGEESPDMETHVMMRPKSKEAFKAPFPPSPSPQQFSTQSSSFLPIPIFQTHSFQSPQEKLNSFSNQNIPQRIQTHLLSLEGEKDELQSQRSPNESPIQKGYLTQGPRVLPPSLQTQIMNSPNQNQVKLTQGSIPMTPGKSRGAAYHHHDNYKNVAQKSPPLQPTKYSSNQFTPYGESGTPIQFTSSKSTSNNMPHYINEYRQHHSISQQILAKLQNSVRTSRSTNLTPEEMNSLLEISKTYPSDKNFVEKMKLGNLLLQKLDLKDEKNENKNTNHMININDKESQEILERRQNQSLSGDVKVGERNERKVEGEEEIKDKKKIESPHLLNKNIRNYVSILNLINSTGNATESQPLTFDEKIEDKEIFRAPKIIQRGFLPILLYSEKDPGPMRVNLRVTPNERNERKSRELVHTSQEKSLVSLTRQ